MATYMIWEGFMNDVQRKMNTIQKKCQKYGVEFTFTVTGNEEYRVVKDENDEEHNLRFVEVTADGKAQLNGWEYLASIDHTEKGNIITSATDLEIPNKYYTSDCYCEHCNKNVWRKYLYLVRNVESGEIKQIGRSCLKDYTHGMSADYVAWYQSLFNGLEEMEEQTPSLGGFGYSDYDYYEVKEVIQYMSETIKHFGYVPNGQEGKQSTSSRAGDYYDVAHDRKHKFRLVPDRFYKIKDEMESIGFNPNSEHAVKEAEDALAWLEEQDESKSTYIHNLKVVVSMGKVQGKHYGILASLITTWNKNLIREAERKAKEMKESKSQHIGEIGQRITIDVESTKIVTSWETDWGYVYLVKFVSTDGNVFMWKASSLNNFPDDLELVKKITGTVKNHDEFRGVKQTFINRCKVV